MWTFEASVRTAWAKAKAKPCRGMQGLVEEGKEKTDVAADLALAVAAQLDRNC
jgi:hypothetical protein